MAATNPISNAGTYERIPDLEVPWGSTSNFTTPVTDVSKYGSITIHQNRIPPSNAILGQNLSSITVDFLDDDPQNPGSTIVTFRVTMGQTDSQVTAGFAAGGFTGSTPVMGKYCRCIYSIFGGVVSGSVVYGSTRGFVAPFPAGSLYP